MNILSGEELEFYMNRGLVKHADGDAPVEDIKVPLRYGGYTERRTKTIEGDHTYKRYEESEVTIRPGETKLLLTEEDVTTREIGKEYPIRIFGRVYAPNSFVRAALDVGTGLIDTSWQGGKPLRIAITNNKSEGRVSCDKNGANAAMEQSVEGEAITIQEGTRIAYVLFEYVNTTSTLTDDDLDEGGGLSDPDFHEAPAQSAVREDLKQLFKRVSELEDKYSTIIEELEELD